MEFENFLCELLLLSLRIFFVERAERARLREERQWLIANGGDVPEELLLSLERNEEGDEDKNDDDNKLDELDK